MISSQHLSFIKVRDRSHSELPMKAANLRRKVYDHKKLSLAS